jgi:signal transduction histidine kinase
MMTTPSEPDVPVADLGQSELFQKVADICSVVNSVLDPQDLLDISLRRVMGLFGANRGSIFIFSPEDDTLRLRVSVGLKMEEKDRMTKRMGQGIVGRVAEEKKPVIVQDIENDRRFSNFKARKAYSSGSFICVPLMLKAELIGVINISDKISGHRFVDEELQLLDFLASQIALNYRRIILYAKFREIVKESRDLRDQLGASGREKEYLKRQVDIQERLATIGKLAGGIAHEFNNPLDGVMRYTNLCLRHTHNDEVLRGYLMEIQQGLRRMANIVRNLLACSRSEHLATTRVDLKGLLERCAGSLRAEQESRNITINCDIPDGLPPIVDLGIERVFSNLLRNALDSIDRDGKVDISVRLGPDEMEIIVRDSGKGIPPDHIEQIFEPFFTTKDIDKGCGLGLTIVGEIIKAYRGRIGVESRPESGAVFTIVLPAHKIL